MSTGLIKIKKGRITYWRKGNSDFKGVKKRYLLGDMNIR